MAHETNIRSGISRIKSRRGIAVPLIIIGVLIIAALVGVSVALVVVLNRPAQIVVREPEPEQRSILVNEDNVEEVAEEMVESEPTPMGYYEVSMNMTWHFPDGASPSTDAFVENVRENTHNVYFDVLLAETMETIYASPVIPLGGQLDNFALDTNLDAGTYDCICSYHLVDENQFTVSTVNVAITVIVES